MLLSKDVSFVSDVILQNLPVKRRRSGTGFLNVNCPMCIYRGHRPDTKMRCGILFQPSNIGIFCFNCGYKSQFVLGSSLGKNFKEFLAAIGVDDMAIKRLNHVAFTYKHMFEGAGIEAEAKAAFEPKFAPMPLPDDAKSFVRLANEGCTDPDFLATVEYVYKRGDDLANSTTFYWSPDTKHNMNRRVIIPFYHEGKIVGYTARAIDDAISNKYHNNSPLNYIFNNHVMTMRSRAFVCGMEGPTDALAIDGVAFLGARLNEQQAQWLKSCGKQIIIVPDRDESGQRLIDAAQANGWAVAFPFSWWDEDVKDVAKAVERYGRLYVLTSIAKTATMSGIEISVKRKLIV